MKNKNSFSKLETKHFEMNIPGPDSANSIAEYWSRNREHFSPWEPIREDEYYTVKFWEKRLQENIDEFHRFTSANFFLLENRSKRVIGQCTFSNIIPGVFQCCNLGFSIDKEFEGKGYMRQALTLGIGYMYERGLHRIQANFIPTNERSSGLLKRLGFSIEGYARDYLFIKGKWTDHVLTSLTNQNIKEPR